MKHNHKDKTVHSTCPACREKKRNDSSYSPATDPGFVATIAAATSFDGGGDCGGGSF